MPDNDPNLDPATDPYLNAGNGELSDYERGEQENRLQQANAAAVERVVNQHRSEVEDACRVRSERFRIEGDCERFESDPAYRIRIEAARRARGILTFSVGIVILIFFADLFLGTPDLAEDLAHPVMSLIPESWQNQTDKGEDGSVSTPNWLRLGIGVVLSMIVLTLTVAAKILGNETPLHDARQRLRSGDTKGWRTISRQIWTRRAIKLSYLAIMVGAFSWLYTYAQERARVMESLAAPSVEEFRWDTLGVSVLSTGEMKTDEVVPATADQSKSNVRKSGLALGAGATYAMLFILHALLVMMPMPRSTIDLPLAKFNPHDARSSAAALRGREEGMLHGIVARIQRMPLNDSVRETLIVLSEPVARAINELYERDLMPLPNSTAMTSPHLANEATPESNHDVPDEDNLFPDDGDPEQGIFRRRA